MSEKARTFQDLLVWQKSHQFVLTIYKMTDGFPQKEIYGLISQLRRSAVSIPANIVEGFKKTGAADKARYFNIAQASLEETGYYLILAQDLGYADCSECLLQLDEIGRLLGAYCNSVLKRVGKRS